VREVRHPGEAEEVKRYETVATREVIELGEGTLDADLEHLFEAGRDVEHARGRGEHRGDGTHRRRIGRKGGRVMSCPLHWNTPYSPPGCPGCERERSTQEQRVPQEKLFAVNGTEQDLDDEEMK
jgi:hypothetical protein